MYKIIQSLCKLRTDDTELYKSNIYLERQRGGKKRDQRGRIRRRKKEKYSHRDTSQKQRDKSGKSQAEAK